MAIDRLTAEDRLMLAVSEAWPQDIGALALLDGGCLFDSTGTFRIPAVRDAIRCRLHLVPQFRQVIDVPARGLGGPHWVDARAFEISEHVRVLPLRAPAGEAELLSATEQLRRQRLDPSHPAVGDVVPDRPPGWAGGPVREDPPCDRGRPCGHGDASDGSLDPAPDARVEAAPPWTPRRPPSARELLADNLRGASPVLPGALSMLGRPRTVLGRARDAWPAARELLAESRRQDEPRPPDRSGPRPRPGPRQPRPDQDDRTGPRRRPRERRPPRGHRRRPAGTPSKSRGEPRRRRDDANLRTPCRCAARCAARMQGTLIAQMVVPLPLGESRIPPEA